MGVRDSGNIIRIYNQLGGVGIRMLGVTPTSWVLALIARGTVESSGKVR